MMLTRFFSSEGMDMFPDQYLFRWPHFLYLFVCALLFFLFFRVIKSDNPKTRRWIINISCILLLFFKYGGEAIFIYEWNHYGSAVSSFSHPFWDWRTLFSFQICGINNVLLPIVIWFNIKPMKDFVYTSSIIGGIAVLVYPVGVLFGDPLTITFPLLRTLFVHFLLVFLPIFLIKNDDFHLEKKHWYRSLIGCLLVIAWSMYGNLFVDTAANNMFLMHNPFGGGPIPLLSDIPDGWHVILMILLVFLCYLLVYGISGRYERKRLQSIREKSSLS